MLASERAQVKRKDVVMVMMMHPFEEEGLAAEGLWRQTQSRIETQSSSLCGYTSQNQEDIART